jgi:hypothetical protein
MFDVISTVHNDFNGENANPTVRDPFYRSFVLRDSLPETA